MVFDFQGEWPYKWVTGVITLLMRVIAPFITDRGPPCSSVLLRFRHLWQRIGCLTRRNHITLPVASATVELEGSLGSNNERWRFRLVCVVGWWNTVQQKKRKNENRKTQPIFLVGQNFGVKPVKLQRVKTTLWVEFFYAGWSHKKTTPLKINGWNIIMKVWFRSFSFLNGWFVGSMLIFQGVSFCTLTWQGKIPRCMIGHASSKHGPFSSHLCEFFLQ